MDGSGMWAEQEALRAEARGVYEDLALGGLLERAGTPAVVGSAALGVMVRRDLDVDVTCERLDDATATAVAEAGARLATHPRVRTVTFRDDRGEWNREPDRYPDGLYLGVECRTPTGAVWNLDVWFLDDPGRQPSTAHLATLLPRLTDGSRRTVLEIKRAWAGRPEYGTSVSGIDVYRAVLDDGVGDPAQFEDWVRRRTNSPD
ncbi:hypothetical protein [Streptomyces sp. NPDC056600]|uniref:hypothetical protein n=1 Tax=Streptomyces sp. NPDC056600 TaxID=3345874 RepID=UPI0036BEF401